MVNCFDLTHFNTLLSSEFMFNSRSESDVALIARQVLSANNVGGKDVLLYMSLYIRNNKGPSADLCGTPYAMYSVVDVILLSVTYCFLSARYEVNRAFA